MVVFGNFGSSSYGNLDNPEREDSFEQYIKPTLTPLNGIENKLITVANGLIKEYRKERESQKVAYYKTIAIVILSSLLLISILIIRLV